jgi:hypothetical protein
MRFNPRVTLVLAIAALNNLSFAQRTTATVGGVIEDSTHAVLPRVAVRLTNEGTAAVLEQLSNDRGEFLFEFVPVGTYALRMEAPGFKSLESRGVALEAAEKNWHTYTLEVGGLNDQVTVTSEAPQVNTVSPEQRMALNTLQVTDLPMLNRNITSIIAAAGSGMTKNELTSNVMGGTRYNLNGLGGGSMSATVDGGNASGLNTSELLGTYGNFAKIEVMSAESVGEVQVVKGVISAEYGGMGGHVTMITRSGTNNYHGSLFERYAGSVLAARQPFLSTKPNSAFNQFGGSVGGPILHNKLFFFFAYEGYRQRSTIPVNAIFPTPYFRNLLLQALPFKETAAALSWNPLPNQPYSPTALGGSWIGPGISNWNDDHVDARVDYSVGGGNLSATFAGGHPDRNEAASNPLAPVQFIGELRRGTVGYVIGKGRLTSSTRAGFNSFRQQRIDAVWQKAAYDANYDSTKPGYAAYWRGMPNISYPGVTLGGGSQDRGINRAPIWTFEQQFAMLSGAHSLKFGGRLLYLRGGIDEINKASVSFQNLTDLMNNTPSGVSLNKMVPPNQWTMPSFSFYVQDDWRVSRKLVLNLGLREENFRPLVAEGSGESTLDGRPSNNQPAAVYNLNGLLDPWNFIWGGLRDPKHPTESDKWNFAPRFGFAYTADSQGKFVIRGGFGVNFAGFDGSIPEESQIISSPYLPARYDFSRAEAASLGLKFPEYNDDLVYVVLAPHRIQPTIREDPHLQSPYAMNYTLGIEKALTSSLVLETAYVGTRGVKFNLTRTFNLPDRITGIRPNPNDVQGNYNDNSQQTVYNSWQTSLRQRLSHHLTFNFHHTWGKSLSYAGGDIAAAWLGDGTYGVGTRSPIEDFNNIKIERVLSAGDVTHNVTADWIYQAPTPFAYSLLSRRILGGWNLSGIWHARTGQPLPNGGILQTGGRPDMINPYTAVNKNCCSFGNLQYLNPAAFQLVPVSSLSGQTIRRGNINAAPARAPAIWNLDLSMGKNFSVTERAKVELRADFLNAFNHTEYKDISNNMANINFGQVISTLASRAIQAQLRLTF